METIEVVAAVIEKDSKIFATQRGYGEFKDKWEFPGGKIEKNESKEEALIREIKEELDIEIRVNDHICTVEYDYVTFHLRMYCYHCSIICGDLILLEHEDAKWLDCENLRSVDWLPADEKVINEVLLSVDHNI